MLNVYLSYSKYIWLHEKDHTEVLAKLRMLYSAGLQWSVIWKFKKMKNGYKWSKQERGNHWKTWRITGKRICAQRENRGR